jgi:hypothetical protein
LTDCGNFSQGAVTSSTERDFVVLQLAVKGLKGRNGRVSTSAKNNSGYNIRAAFVIDFSERAGTNEFPISLY